MFERFYLTLSGYLINFPLASNNREHGIICFFLFFSFFSPLFFFIFQFMELIIHGMKSTVNRICRDEETVFVADWIYFSAFLSNFYSLNTAYPPLKITLIFNPLSLSLSLPPFLLHSLFFNNIFHSRKHSVALHNYEACRVSFTSKPDTNMKQKESHSLRKWISNVFRLYNTHRTILFIFFIVVAISRLHPLCVTIVPFFQNFRSSKIVLFNG